MNSQMKNTETRWVEELPDGTIHNPANAWHFMRIKPVAGTVRVTRDAEVLAESAGAVRLIEVGRDFYDPVIYLPRSDVLVELVDSPETTHCPLKGDAIYFDLASDEVTVSKIAWSYPDPFPFAAEITLMIAFFPQHVTIEERPF
ncbi:MAG: DUF427 domain-containing protein [Pseudomonadota bacterium]